MPRNTYLHTHRMLCQVHTGELAFSPLLAHTHARKSFTDSVTCCPTLLPPHLSSPFLLSGARLAPLPLLDLLHSLVRVSRMPLRMLIVHCSKAVFIKMIKRSQTTAKYLKASGRRT